MCVCVSPLSLSGPAKGPKPGTVVYIHEIPARRVPVCMCVKSLPRREKGVIMVFFFTSAKHFQPFTVIKQEAVNGVRICCFVAIVAVAVHSKQQGEAKRCG